MAQNNHKYFQDCPPCFLLYELKLILIYHTKRIATEEHNFSFSVLKNSEAFKFTHSKNHKQICCFVKLYRTRDNLPVVHCMVYIVRFMLLDYHLCKQNFDYSFEPDIKEYLSISIYALCHSLLQECAELKTNINSNTSSESQRVLKTFLGQLLNVLVHRYIQNSSDPQTKRAKLVN